MDRPLCFLLLSANVKPKNITNRVDLYHNVMKGTDYFTSY